MNKDMILSIETSTGACSAALSKGKDVIGSICITEPKAHASKLAPMIDRLMKENGMEYGELAAVAVSEGPGSYTGLRVGVSTAKGICYGSGAKLIGINTLDILAAAAGKTEEDSIIIPMIDARRMEVYCAVYDSHGKRISETEAKVLDATSFSEEFGKYGKITFIGDGCSKFREIISNPKAEFICTSPSAEHMAASAAKALAEKDFQDIAYFEPRYLKEFVAGISKKKII